MTDVFIIGTGNQGQADDERFRKVVKKTLVGIKALETAEEFIRVVFLEDRSGKENTDIGIYVCLGKTETDQKILQDVSDKITSEAKKEYPDATCIKVDVPPFDSLKHGFNLREFLKKAV